MAFRRGDAPYHWESIENSNYCIQRNTTDGKIIIAGPCPVDQLPTSLAPTPLTGTITAQPSGSSVIPSAGAPPSSSAVTDPQVQAGTPNSNSTSPAAKGKDGLSDGAVAGVAIGMLLAGLLVAGLIFSFLLRRQKRRQGISYQLHHTPHNTYTSPQEKGPTVVTGAVASNIDDLLPQPAADDTITDQVSKIRDNIKNHVRTYYHTAPVAVAGLNEAGLRDLATATGVSTSVLVGTLSNPLTRPDALRLIIGWVILSRCTGERNASLLPAELAALTTSVSSRDDSNTTQTTLYSKWKTITGALLQQRFGKNVQDPGRTQTFAIAIAELDSILAPFVQGSVDGGQRRKNLDMILTRSANFAFLLFSQPGSFDFDFSGGHGGLIAFPALLQTIGDQGQVLRPSRVLVEKEVA